VRDTLWLPVSVFNANKPIFTFQILHSKHQSKGNRKKERKEKQKKKNKEKKKKTHLHTMPYEKKKSMSCY